ncbi:hypothetical protein RMSM_05261 [Rhodopirellula maiorica SM1]|uniref:Uncharacterized protein n=1 Tax=Rhodopirellula maiorica SM1 TaxID=1265738 RepID=M5RR26_9BACT|nr:hypothetical protein RMSM_05261 [Rhodopirellula maiorica SM1]
MNGLSAQQTGSAGAALGSQAIATIRFTWLFVVLAATHLFLDATALNQLAESTYCLLNGFPVSNH